MSLRHLVVVPLLALAACPAPPDPDPGFCTDLMEADSACMNEDNLADCEEANEACPGEVLVMESCPLQFGCP